MVFVGGFGPAGLPKWLTHCTVECALYEQGDDGFNPNPISDFRQSAEVSCRRQHTTMLALSNLAFLVFGLRRSWFAPFFAA